MFSKSTGKNILLKALLTAVIVFATALSVNVAADNITRLVIVSSVLSAVAAFCQALLELRKHD